MIDPSPVFMAWVSIGAAVFATIAAATSIALNLLVVRLRHQETRSRLQRIREQLFRIEDRQRLAMAPRAASTDDAGC